MLSVSHSLALTLLPSCPLSPFTTSALLSLSHHFSGSFRGRLSCFLRFSHASAGYERIVLCLWENGNRGRKERRGERKGGPKEVNVCGCFYRKSDCLTSVWSLQQLEGDIRLLFALLLVHCVWKRRSERRKGGSERGMERWKSDGGFCLLDRGTTLIWSWEVKLKLKKKKVVSEEVLRSFTVKTEIS